MVLSHATSMKYCQMPLNALIRHLTHTELQPSPSGQRLIRQKVVERERERGAGREKGDVITIITSLHMARVLPG